MKQLRTVASPGRSAVAVPVHFFIITGDFWYALVVPGTAARHPCDLVRVRNRYGQTSSTSPDKVACRGIFALIHCKSLMNGLELVEDNRVPAGVHCVDLGKCVDSYGSLQRHTLGDNAHGAVFVPRSRSLGHQQLPRSSLRWDTLGIGL